MCYELWVFCVSDCDTCLAVFSVACVCVFGALFPVWLCLRGCVCCDFCAFELCTVGTLLFVVCVCPVRSSLWSAG